jgi:hypothetical protein
VAGGEKTEKTFDVALLPAPAYIAKTGCTLSSSGMVAFAKGIG